MPVHGYSTTKRLLFKLENLLEETDKKSKVEFRSIVNNLCCQTFDSEFCPAGASQALIEFLPRGNDRIIAIFLTEIRPRCRVSVELVVRLLARIMQIAEWDGRGIIDDIPKRAEPGYDHISNSLINSLMCAGSVPRKVLDILSIILADGDRDMVLATLVYILSWCFGCEDDADISNFFPDLEKQFADADAVIRDQVTRIRELIHDLEEERREK